MGDSDNAVLQETLDRYYSALKAGDKNAIKAVVSDEIIVRYPAPDGLLPWSGEWVGLDSFFEFLDQVGAHLEILDVTILRTEYFEGGVLVILKGSWMVKATKRTVKATVANIFDIKDGKITGYQVFNDTAAFGEAMR